MKSSFFVACLLVPLLTTSYATTALARETYATSRAVGHKVSAPPWSAACMTDHGPSVCGEPMWVYGGPAR
jgi:hypothetical protein